MDENERLRDEAPPQASQDDEDERRWRYACAIAYCDELGYARERVYGGVRK